VNVLFRIYEKCLVWRETFAKRRISGRRRCRARAIACIRNLADVAA